MTHPGHEGSAYLLGHSDDELERLERQAEFFAEETADTLIRAGLAPGMKVLDLGCGVGDVSIAAARIVGSSGSVLGLDTSADAIATANRRLQSLGIDWARCAEGNIFDVDGSGYDAVVGRFILMHLAEPVRLLMQFRRGLKPGGIVAFVEMDISSASITPPMPLFERCAKAVIDVYRGAGSEPDMGSRLFATLRQAGFDPKLRGTCRVEGGPEARVYAYLAATVRSLWPSMVAQGISVPGATVEDLAERLMAEASLADYSVAYPRLTGGWARVA